jgi:hypothetical protein
VGIVTSLLMPVEALWRRAAHLMQEPITAFGDYGFESPFAAFSVPSPAMVVYSIAYAIGALALAMHTFSRRDL